MENNLPVIPIFFAVDDGYIPFLAVTLESLIANSSEKFYYSIKILYTSISEENKKKISKYNRENINIEFVDLNYYINEVKDKLYTRDYYTKTTYFRLFIPNLYPQYDKVIYLDSDTVILGDISELYNIDIKGKLLAAAPDDAVQSVKQFQDYVERVVGTSSYKNYFNAGILVMNLDEMRRFDFQSKFMYLLGTMKFTVAQDQDYLNRLCKGRVKIIPGIWNRMPIPNENIDDEDIKIIHFNLAYKPWHFENIMYQEHFWKYAKNTEYLEQINYVKDNYTEEERFRDMEQFKKLKELAVYETSCVGDDRENKMKEFDPEKRDQRLKILKKIEEFERNGTFDIDVEDDPEAPTLMPEDVDYLNEKSYSRLKSRIANKVGAKFLDELIKENKLIIRNIIGMENLQAVSSGAIITCNHFNPFDSFAIEEVFRESKQNKTKKLYKVIREGNYTNFPGLYGFFFRNCDTLPLSSNTNTMVEFMKAVDTILQRNDFILIYPEQSMWWNYRKPKPLKPGAYRFAARNNVPVIPIFITMQDTDIIGDDGFPIQEYTINIEKPIYPEAELSEKENSKKMLEKNAEVWKNIYEDFYEIPLEYTTKKEKEDGK
ncbi:MAG: 1-acyl-sn-glycerol-3-phosphate acyltransferase [Clostridia bacterium]|nr:1-acyl-sn-glycerol-3-phosphate acyltransferase [Clostridia bacterium]